MAPETWAIICAALSAALLARAYQIYRRGRATLRWRPVDGEITWSLVDQEERHGRRGRTYQMYRASIKYKYTIGSKEYEGDRVYFGSNLWVRLPELARELADRYAPGVKMRVYVDPARPTEAVLIRGRVHSHLYYRNGILIAGLLAVFAILLLLLRNQRIGP